MLQEHTNLSFSLLGNCQPKYFEEIAWPRECGVCRCPCAPLTRIWCFETMTDKDIIDQVTGSSVTPPPEEDEDDTEAKVPTNTDASEHSGNTILWLEVEDEADQMHM